MSFTSQLLYPSKHSIEGMVSPKTNLDALKKKISMYICPKLNRETPTAKLRAVSQYGTLADGSKCYRLKNISYQEC